MARAFEISANIIEQPSIMQRIFTYFKVIDVHICETSDFVYNINENSGLYQIIKSVS